MLKVALAVAVGGSLIGAAGIVSALAPATQSGLPMRGVAPFVSRESAPAIILPGASPDYCLPSSAAAIPAPPNTILGHLTIDGAPAPAGTIVQLQFGGELGPAAAIAASGGYRVDFAAGGGGHEPPCINEVGAPIAILVNGVSVDTGHTVGDAGGPLTFFDVAI